MEVSFSIIVWKHVLLLVSILLSALIVPFMSCGIAVWGSAAIVPGSLVISGIGLWLFYLSCVGCFAAMRDSYISFRNFGVLASLTAICNFIYLIIFLIKKNDIVHVLNVRVQDAWTTITKTNDAMKSIQENYECCGLNGPQDYYRRDYERLPLSCCYLSDCTQQDNVFQAGCTLAAPNYVNAQSMYFILTCLGLMLVEALGVLAAYHLAKSVEHVDPKENEIVITQA